MVTSNREARAAIDALDWAHETLSLDWTEVATAVDADRRTIYRWLHCSVPALRGDTPGSVIKRGRMVDVMGARRRLFGRVRLISQD
jgi:hypothetical protein